MIQSRISSRAEYECVMARVDKLMEMDAGQGPAAGSDLAAELTALAALAEDYERKTFRLDDAV